MQGRGLEEGEHGGRREGGRGEGGEEEEGHGGEEEREGDGEEPCDAAEVEVGMGLLSVAECCFGRRS